MRLLIVAAAAASAIAAPAASQAMDPQFSVSGGYARYVDGSEDWDGHSATVRGSVRLHRYFGVDAEGAAGLGSSDVGGADVTMNYNIAAYAVAYLPLSENADVFARLGYGSTEFEVDFGGGLVASDSYSGVTAGIGGQYFFDANNGVRMDVTRHEYEDLDGGLDSVAITYVRRF